MTLATSSTFWLVSDVLHGSRSAPSWGHELAQSQDINLDFSEAQVGCEARCGRCHVEQHQSHPIEKHSLVLGLTGVPAAAQLPWVTPSQSDSVSTVALPCIDSPVSWQVPVIYLEAVANLSSKLSLQPARAAPKISNTRASWESLIKKIKNRQKQKFWILQGSCALWSANHLHHDWGSCVTVFLVLLFTSLFNYN